MKVLNAASVTLSALMLLSTLTLLSATNASAQSGASIFDRYYGGRQIQSRDRLLEMCRAAAIQLGYANPVVALYDEESSFGSMIKANCRLGNAGNASSSDVSNSGGYSSGSYAGSSGSSSGYQTQLPNGPTAWKDLDTVSYGTVSRSVNGYDTPASLENKCRLEGRNVPRAVASRANLQNCVATPTSGGDYVQCRLTQCDYRVIN